MTNQEIAILLCGIVIGILFTFAVVKALRFLDTSWLKEILAENTIMRKYINTLELRYKISKEIEQVLQEKIKVLTENSNE